MGFDMSGFFIKETLDKPHLLPGSPFVLQVKPPSFRLKSGSLSKRHSGYLAKHIREFVSVNVPIYFGVVTSDKKSIDIYSCQPLLALVAWKGAGPLCDGISTGHIKLQMELVEAVPMTPLTIVNAGPDEVTVYLHKVTTVTPSTGINSAELRLWTDDCQTYLATIESYSAGEFIYQGSQMMQFIGIGTFCHALKRMMHASCMLAEEIYHHNNRFVNSTKQVDHRLLIQLGETAEQINQLRNDLRDHNEMESIVDDLRWQAWYSNATAIAESVKR